MKIRPVKMLPRSARGSRIRREQRGDTGREGQRRHKDGRDQEKARGRRDLPRPAQDKERELDSERNLQENVQGGEAGIDLDVRSEGDPPKERDQED